MQSPSQARRNKINVLRQTLVVKHSIALNSRHHGPFTNGPSSQHLQECQRHVCIFNLAYWSRYYGTTIMLLIAQRLLLLQVNASKGMQCTREVPRAWPRASRAL